ncbi:lipid A-modifier LpxR family protein [Flammeovirga aprica]|uniref:Lipid A deacylase LpxR family protein n=1 Tax=Flammeovirga aprica JL-4 TaxID=694437 RepID=A0A7X9RZ20_9BACT|nr:lipid A-modifier LpxR family protein [Flammeovirga aprica]NME71341.1 lipid A deacylase LpxR family protein [Flammeovirga aprica JL-4]
MKLLLLIFCLSTFSIPLYSQVDSLGKQQSEYISLSSQNDFYQYWLQSDRNFTNGIHITWSSHHFNNKVMDKILFGLKHSTQKEFSLILGQDMHTPENAALFEVDSTDRPYAGLLYLTYRKVTTDYWRALKLETNLYVGVQGPAAGAGATQNFMHSLFLENTDFNGWGNQIGNGLVLDLDVEVSKMLPLTGKIYETNIFGKAHIGTIYNYFLSGLQFKLGKYNDTYYSRDGIRQKYPPRIDSSDKMSKARRKKNGKKGLGNTFNDLLPSLNNVKQIYFFTEFQVGALLYDGTAQGSLIQFESSPYVLKAEQIDPLILNWVYGINFNWGRFMFQYYRVVVNDSFRRGNLFGWGEISVFYGL